jgi:hypothetical protein
MQTPARPITPIAIKNVSHGLHLKRFPVVENVSVPADGINCPYLNGTFGTLPSCWQPSVGSHPVFVRGIIH